MQAEGRLTVCDRCGKEKFEKILTTHTRDGGYSSYNEYEKIDGWKTVDGKHLCPECAKIYNEFITGFYKEEE